MQGKKAVFLFLALLLPVGIFIFLKLFGKNEFNVPAFYQDKAPATGCDFEYKAPYKIADSVITSIAAKGKSDLYLIHFSALPPRLEEELDSNEVTSIDAGTQWTAEGRAGLSECVLAIPKSEDLVLVDKEGKIRGYYVSTDREEVDRLLLELGILLKKY